MLGSRLSTIVFCLFSGTLLAQSAQFLEAPQYATGKNPQAAAVGDFNGDGIPDLAIVNASSNTVSVLLGKGNGTFSPKVDYATGSTPVGIAVGDFINNGNLDLAITNSGSNTVSILLGNGNGTFQSKKDFATGNGPRGIAVGDFNQDGYPDLVVTNVTDSTVGVLLNSGSNNLSFKSMVAYSTQANPYAIAVGDFTGSGILDLAVANNLSSINQSQTVSVLLGNGDGTFQTQVTEFSAGNNPVSIAIADLNGDGIPDIVVADQQDNAISVLLGTGTGFQRNVEYATAESPASVAIVDLDGDGKLDVAVADSNGNTVTVLWGVGDGTFQGYSNCGTGNLPVAVVAGDFNGTATPDLAVVNSADNSVSVVVYTGQETFQSRMDYPAGTVPSASANPSPYSIATGDFNGDGIPDLAITSSSCPGYPNCNPGTIAILLGNGNGTFQGPSVFSTGPETDPQGVAVGNFGNNVADVAVANYSTNTVGVMVGAGNGTLTSLVTYAVEGGPTTVATADLRGVGIQDLVVTNSLSNAVSVLLGNGDTTFNPATNYQVGNTPVAVAIGDFNGDNIPDLAVVNQTDNPPTVGILLGKGDGTFDQSTYKSYSVGSGGNPTAITTGNFSGNGILDLAVADSAKHQVKILMGNGDGTFQKVQAYAAGTSPSSIVMADFNGDGKLDLALTGPPLGSSAGNVVSLLLGNGDGTFGSATVPYTLFGVGYLSYAAVVGDFNGDGKPDVAVATGGSDTVSVLLNAQGTVVSTSSSANPSSFGQSVTFTTTVSATTNTGILPTGTVTLMNGATTLGSGTLVSGQASVTTTALPVGTDTVSAVYSGDSNYQPNTITLTQTVQKGTPGAAVSSSQNPATINQSVTFTATLSWSGTVPPTGSVSFLDGTTNLGSSSVNASGVATLSISTLNVGTHNITASYGGDGNFNPGTSGVLNQTVQAGNTTTALTSSLNPSTESASVTFTATVSSLTGIMPTGTVKFMDGTSTLGSSAVNASGVATFTTAALSTGTNNITALYSGDNDSDASTSVVISQVVQRANTSLALSAPTSANLNQSVTFTATLTSGSPGTPTGTVTFLNGSSTLGSAAVSASGIASFSTSALAAGGHTISAEYSGDNNFNSASQSINLTVVAPNFSLSASAPSPSTVAPGASTKATVTITPSGGLDPSTLTLSCSITPAVSSPATCSFGAISITNNIGTATLTIATAGSQSAFAAPLGNHDGGMRFALGLMIPAMLLSGAGLRKLNKRKLLNLCFAAVLMGAFLFVTACGSGSGSGNTTPPPSGTSAGTYTVTVSGTADGITQKAPSVTFAVQ